MTSVETSETNVTPVETPETLTMQCKIDIIEKNISDAICKSNECVGMFNDKTLAIKNELTAQITKTQNTMVTIKERINELVKAHTIPTPIEYTDEYLYVILPYFNYCCFKKRTELFTNFVKEYKNYSGVRIVIVEGIVKDASEQLPDLSSDVFMHITIQLEDRIWIKENLINLGIKRIPSDWKYVSWIDADISFLNKNWVFDTLDLLQKSDIVQLFHSAVNMGPEGESIKVEQGFIYMAQKSGEEFKKTSKYSTWHPGFGWACTRKTYDKIGGLLDIAILGSGDRHMALSLIGKADASYPGNIGLSYKAKVLDFQERCTGLIVDYVKGTILHHFHGSMVNRKYVDRWNILLENLYNVKNDIYYNDEGVISLTEKGKRMQPDMDEYFLERNEDAVTI